MMHVKKSIDINCETVIYNMTNMERCLSSLPPLFSPQASCLLLVSQSLLLFLALHPSLVLNCLSQGAVERCLLAENLQLTDCQQAVVCFFLFLCLVKHHPQILGFLSHIHCPFVTALQNPVCQHVSYC